jgi:TetR/AcrR family transcriptional regulator, repressor for neighboring sulfatase
MGRSSQGGRPGVRPTRERRRRRTAGEARHEILQVAKRHLAIGGPDAIRLHAIASEIGVTHQAILRHFRTRDQLMAALLRHAGKGLRDEISVAIAAPSREPASARKLYEAIDEVYRKRGYARVSAGLVLKGKMLTGSGLYREAAEAIHRSRREAGEATSRATREDTLFAIALVSLVAWAEALVGSAMRRAVDLPDDEATARRFRAWFADLVEDHLFPKGRSRAVRREGASSPQ